MLKFLLVPITVLFISLGTDAVPVNGITLDKHYKVESTFSGDTADQESFHLIIAKNTKAKNYEIIPYKYENDALIKLKSISFKTKPVIVSYHNNEGTLTLVSSTKIKKDKVFQIVDIDINSGAFNKSDTIDGEDFKTVIRKENTSILIYAMSGKIKILNIFNTSKVETVTAKPDEHSSPIMKSIRDESIEAVNKTEFVSNGSINKVRAYSEGDDVIITSEIDSDGSTTATKIPLNETDEITFNTKKYKAKFDGKFKKSTSFVDGKNLYQIKINKKSGDLNVFSFEDDDVISHSLSEAKISKTSEGFKGVEDFLKASSKSAFEPTVAVNKSKSGNIVLRLDYVLKNAYNYNYNWWWHHQWFMQQQMWHHQQMMQIQQNVPRFTPSPEYYDELAYYKPVVHHYFEIVLDANKVITASQDEETIHIYLDKKTYVQDVNNNRHLKNASSVFVGTTFRYFAFNKKTKVYDVVNRNLDD